MARTVDTLFDTTGGTAAVVDTGALSTQQYDQVLIVAVGAGAAAPTGWTIQTVDDAAASLTLASPTNPGIGATLFASVMPGGTLNMPVPKRLRVQITGGAGSTARLRIEGIRNTGL